MKKKRVEGIVTSIFVFFVSLSAFATHLNSDQLAFVHSMISAIKVVNQHIHSEQTKLIQLNKQFLAGKPLNSADIKWLQDLAQHYYVHSSDFEKQVFWQVLKQRVDVLPISLILAQAVYESDWGKSRFAQLGNNYFGIRCYTRGCGLVPEGRAEGETFEVRRFPTKVAAIQYYVHTLNTFKHYQTLRDLRYEQRITEESLDGMLLAAGLAAYSQQTYYVKAIQSLISRYAFYHYDELT